MENQHIGIPLQQDLTDQPPLTQSKAWQKLQDDLGERSVFREQSSYRYLAIIKHTPVGNYVYCPYGPVAADAQGFTAALTDLRRLSLEDHALFLRIEPQNPAFTTLFPPHSLKTKDLNPKDTWVLDLTQDRPTIITNFSQGTRTRYNTYAKKGLSVETTRELSAIHYLVDLQNKLFKTKNLNTFSENYLKTELKQPFATLYLVKYHHPVNAPAGNSNPSSSQDHLPSDGQVLAASLFFDYAGIRYYMQSAADTEYKKLPATVALLTQAIFDAKDQGLKTFDFWGIAPDDAPADHPWRGFTEFKKSFGGTPLHYAGTYDIVLNPAKYKLYQSTRRLHRFLRKV